MEISSETFYDRSMDLPQQLLHGAIDSHVHAGPVLKSNPGRVDPFEAAEDAKAAGMRALVYYDVFGTSGGTAWMVSRRIEGIDVFGGIILSSCQGGLNPRAVLTALYYGAGVKFVSLGAHCTYHQASREGRLLDGKAIPFKDLYPKFASEELSRAIRIPLTDPVPNELNEILQMVADHPDVYLNTGHISGEEVIRLVELALRFGIKRLLVAHPARLELTVEQQKEIASEGYFLEGALVDWFYPSLPRSHYYVEREYRDELLFRKRWERGGFVEWAGQIREVGIQHFVLGTDYGIRAAPKPIEGMRTLVSCLLDVEFTPHEIQTMITHNPACLLGLPPLD